MNLTGRQCEETDPYDVSGNKTIKVGTFGYNDTYKECKARKIRTMNIADINKLLSEKDARIKELEAYIVDYDICICDHKHDYVCEKCEIVDKALNG